MAASLTIETIREMAGVDAPIVRIMPNLPVSVGKGVILYTASGAEKTLPGLLEALSPAGMLLSVEERLIDAGSAVAGCGPAFACLFIEALADGGGRLRAAAGPGPGARPPDAGGHRRTAPPDRPAPGRP